ncbi:MAG: hypothetical protein ABI325_03605 [Ginsengibacter sp.]
MNDVLEQEWNSYFLRLNEMEKKSVLLMLKTLLQHRDVDSGRISTEDYNREIVEALEEANKGIYIAQDQMEKRASEW